MHVDPYVALAGLIVGFTVGLTGMGGGALMTPILVLLFKFNPTAAVSSDLVAAMIMKPVGGGVHARRGTVNWSLVKWLCMGSVPFAFLGALVLRFMGNGEQVQDRLKLVLGGALVLAAATIVIKAALQRRAERRAHRLAAEGSAASPAPLRIRPLPTLAIGALGGLVVGMTSVGSGSLIIVLLLILYPMLSTKQLVGTDLIQAVPLVTAAALGHLLFGDFKLGLTASILLGSLPGVYIGARLSARAPDIVIRPALAFVLLASGLKLVNVPTETLGILLAALALVVPPVMGALDAIRWPDLQWKLAGRSKRRWIGWQAAGAPFGVGFVASMAYFFRARPHLAALTVEAETQSP